MRTPLEVQKFMQLLQEIDVKPFTVKSNNIGVGPLWFSLGSGLLINLHTFILMLIIQGVAVIFNFVVSSFVKHPLALAGGVKKYFGM